MLGLGQRGSRSCPATAARQEAELFTSTFWGWEGLGRRQMEPGPRPSATRTPALTVGLEPKAGKGRVAALGGRGPQGGPNALASHSPCTRSSAPGRQPQGLVRVQGRGPECGGATHPCRPSKELPESLARWPGPGPQQGEPLGEARPGVKSPRGWRPRTGTWSQPPTCAPRTPHISNHRCHPDRTPLLNDEHVRS